MATKRVEGAEGNGGWGEGRRKLLERETVS